MIAAIAAIIGVIGIVVILVAYSAFSWGWITYKFWYWFLLPVFPQLPHVTVWQAIGLCMFISLFKNHSSEHVKDEYKDKKTQMWMSVLNPWIMLVLGWCIWCWIN